MGNLEKGTFLNSSTGEETDVLIRQYRHRTGLKHDSYFLGHRDGFMIIAQLDLGRHEYRVLLALIAVMDFANEINHSQKYIADELGMKPAYVSKAISKLKLKGLVIAINKDGKKSMRVSSVITWKGQTNSATKYGHEFREAYEHDSTLIDIPGL